MRGFWTEDACGGVGHLPPMDLGTGSEKGASFRQHALLLRPLGLFGYVERLPEPIGKICSEAQYPLRESDIRLILVAQPTHPERKSPHSSQNRVTLLAIIPLAVMTSKSRHSISHCISPSTSCCSNVLEDRHEAEARGRECLQSLVTRYSQVIGISRSAACQLACEAGEKNFDWAELARRG